MTCFTKAFSTSRSCALLVKPRKSNRYGSFSDSRARSDSASGRLAVKLVTALPLRSSRRVSICITKILRDQLCSMAWAAYQRRVPGPGSLSSNAKWWYQGNCASTSCTNCASGQAWAKARIYFRLRGENPFISGNAARKSCASRSITLAPQPCTLWRVSMSLPICQYNSTSSRLMASAARCWAV